MQVQVGSLQGLAPVMSFQSRAREKRLKRTHKLSRV